MTTDVHQLDDGAWISVNDSREVNVSDLWLLARSDVCDCEPADFLAEGFVEVSVDYPTVEATSFHVPERRTRLASRE